MSQQVSRRHFLGTAVGALAASRLPFDSLARPVPSKAQLEWQRDELAMFIHFGVNTFTNREWGDGTEYPSIFAPANLDARQWARSARAAGFRAMVLTAKHHDGFCLWPSKTTKHSVASSPFRGGAGNLVREFVDACRAEGLKPGLYLSPWDRHEPSYGDSPRYNDLYCDQLTELLTQYGTINEVWFDGANGEGPNGKRQVYDWPRVWGLVRKLQPNAVMFSDAGPDIRWIGNERGVAGVTNWSTVDPRIVTRPGQEGAEVMRSLQDGDAEGSVWRPGETDVSIRPGWFYHPAEDAKVKTEDDLVQLYFTSVGRNSKLLLNVPPTTQGLLHDVDVARLAGMRKQLGDLFRNEVASGGRVEWRATGPRSGTVEIDLGRSTSIAIARLEEDIARGQIVARYALQAQVADSWRELASGTTIGYCKLDRFDPVTTRRVRLTISEALEAPRPVRVKLYS
jgi:alpha-L-fucosidase